MNISNQYTIPEILAPAGSMEALKAAVHAGADAVYLGGSRFGARAFANNFDGEELIDAIEYAHLYGVKVYLTINTLFRDEEIKQLYDYLLQPYEKGLDAVIVQDFGVMKYVHHYFPELPIHASTQMTITTPYAYTILKKYGVTRVVPARELSIEEIANLKSIADFIPETEVFVQGALCYCYSGQCLMSSFLGGRSGNRGRCAQTCRLPYRMNNQGKQYDGHLLSPKDLCGLQQIPNLIKAGVDSFKIEGRMKKPEYVAVCVRAYRECVDAFINNQLTNELIQKHTKNMAEVFNRGGFTEGYYQQHNGRHMMYTAAPGNIGVKIGTISQIQKNKLTIRLCENVSVGDLLTIDGKKSTINLTCNCEGKSSRNIILNAPKTNELSVGTDVRRMQSSVLQENIREYLTDDKKLTVSGCISICEGQEATFWLSTVINNQKYQISCLGDLVETAGNNPLSEDTVRNKILATGNTRFIIDNLDVELSSKPFYSLKALKDLRRNALLKLEEQIIHSTYRKQHILKDAFVDHENFRNKIDYNQNFGKHYEVIVSNKDQFMCAKDMKVDRIMFDLQYFEDSDLLECLNNCKSNAYIVLPAILRKNNMNQVKEFLMQICATNNLIKGVVIRNIDEFALVKTLKYTGEIITDYSFYLMNQYAFDFVKEHFDNADATLPVELNEGQLVGLAANQGDVSLIVYGYQPLMVSAQCLQNTTNKCNHGNQDMQMVDRYNKKFHIHTFCKYCYNIIYNGIPTVLFDLDLPKQLSHCNQRLHFTHESSEEMKEILLCFFEHKEYLNEKTRGHYRRGVD